MEKEKETEKNGKTDDIWGDIEKVIIANDKKPQCVLRFIFS